MVEAGAVDTVLLLSVRPGERECVGWVGELGSWHPVGPSLQRQRKPGGAALQGGCIFGSGRVAWRGGQGRGQRDS